MDIKEIQERKKRLENLIFEELREFEKATGMCVEDIDIDRLWVVAVPPSEIVSISLDVRI